MQILLILIPLFRLNTLLQLLVSVGGGVIIHDMHVVNTVRPSLPEVPCYKVSLLLRFFRTH